MDLERPRWLQLHQWPLADVTLLGGAYAIYPRHNCHAKACWRIGRHKVGGTEFIVCRKHHPPDTPTAEQILEAHHAAVDAPKGPLEHLPLDRPPTSPA